MKRYAIVAAVLALLAGLGIWWYSDTQVLKRRTKSLLSTLTLESGAGRVSRQMGSYQLNRLLAAEVTLDTPTIKEANGTFDRQELESAYSWLCNQAKMSRFEAKSFNHVTVSGDKATVDVRLFGVVELPNYRPADGNYDVIFRWERGEDGWRIARASWKKAP